MAISKTVLLTRPAGYNDALAEKLNRRGFASVQRPLLEILPVQPDETVQQQILGLDRFDDIIFVSGNAVRFGLPLLEAWWPQWPTLEWYAVGGATAEALADFSIKARYPVTSGSEGLLALPDMQQKHGRNVLIVRGREGRQLIADELSRRGASVEYLAVYESRNIDYGNSLNKDLENQSIDLCVITSGQSCEHLLGSINPSELDRLHLVVPSERVAGLASAGGCRNVHVAVGADDDALIKAIIETSYKSNSDKP